MFKLDDSRPVAKESVSCSAKSTASRLEVWSRKVTLIDSLDRSRWAGVARVISSRTASAVDALYSMLRKDMSSQHWRRFRPGDQGNVSLVTR